MDLTFIYGKAVQQVLVQDSSAASGTNSNQNYIPDVLTQTTWFR